MRRNFCRWLIGALALIMGILVLPCQALAESNSDPYNFLEWSYETLNQDGFMDYAESQLAGQTTARDYFYELWQTEYNADNARVLLEIAFGLYDTIQESAFDRLNITQCAYFSGVNAYDTSMNAAWNASAQIRAENINEGFCGYTRYGDTEIITIAFRGSVSVIDWVADFLCGNDGGIHYGFNHAATEFLTETSSRIEFQTKRGRESCAKLMARAASGDKSVRFVFTGHSLGGAIAQVCMARLLSAGVDKEQLIAYTFASPVPFSEQFVQSLPANPHCYNIVNEYDLVPYIGILTNAPIMEGMNIPLDDIETAFYNIETLGLFAEYFNGKGIAHKVVKTGFRVHQVIYAYNSVLSAIIKACDFMSTESGNEDVIMLLYACYADMLGAEKQFSELYLFNSVLPQIAAIIQSTKGSAMDDLKLATGITEAGDIFVFYNPVQSALSIIFADKVLDAQTAQLKAQIQALVSNLDYAAYEIYDIVCRNGSDGVKLGKTVYLDNPYEHITALNMLSTIATMHGREYYEKWLPNNSRNRKLDAQMANSNSANDNLVISIDDVSLLWKTVVTDTDFRDERVADDLDYIYAAPSYVLRDDMSFSQYTAPIKDSAAQYWDSFSNVLHIDDMWFWTIDSGVWMQDSTGTRRKLCAFSDSSFVYSLTYEDGWLYMQVADSSDGDMNHTMLITLRINIETEYIERLVNRGFYGDMGFEECAFSPFIPSIIYGGNLYFLAQEGKIVDEREYGKYYEIPEEYAEWHMMFSIYRYNISNKGFTRVSDLYTNSSHFAIYDDELYILQPDLLTRYNLVSGKVQSVKLPDLGMNAVMGLCANGIIVRSELFEEGMIWKDTYVVSYDMELLYAYLNYYEAWDGGASEYISYDYQRDETLDENIATAAYDSDIIGAWRLNIDESSITEEFNFLQVFGEDSVYFRFDDDGSGSIYSDSDAGMPIKWNANTRSGLLNMTAFGETAEVHYYIVDNELTMMPNYEDDSAFDWLTFNRVN